MARKINQLSIDGIGVGLSKARFADTFDVADGDENLLAFDEEVVYVVVARVSTPSFRESRNGEVSRVNVLKVKEARLVRSEESKTTILDTTRFDYRPQPSLFDDLEGVEELNDADLEAVGVVVQPSLPEVAEAKEEESEIQAYLDKINAIADEYEEDPSWPDEDLPQRGTVVAVHKHEGDPMLSRFLEE